MKISRRILMAAATIALMAATSPAMADLKFGVAAEPYPPFTSKDASGVWVGWEVDFMNAVCAEIGEKCTIEEVAWDGIIPALQAKKFDVIMAFSVFTHTHQQEMLDLVSQLRLMLTSNGALAFTFTDPSYDRSLSDPTLPAGTDVRKLLGWRRAENPTLEIEEMVETARQSDWCLVVDEKLYVAPGPELSHQEHQGRPWESYCSYFTVDYLSSLFPTARIYPPVSPEWQHCCVITASEG